MRLDVWAGRAGLAVLICVCIIDVVCYAIGNGPILGPEAHGDVLHGALAAIVISKLVELRAASIAPVREAFLHGYQKCKEDQAETSSAESGGRLLHLPMHAFSGAADQLARIPRGRLDRNTTSKPR